MPAESGQRFSVTSTPSGDTLSLHGAASSPGAIQCRNDLAQGTISASLYKSGKPWMQSAPIPPAQEAVFEYVPTLIIGVIPGAEEGEVMDSAILSNINTELSLLGVAKANIIMTGGGPGQTSTPFRFALEDVVMA